MAHLKTQKSTHDVEHEEGKIRPGMKFSVEGVTLLSGTVTGTSNMGIQAFKNIPLNDPSSENAMNLRLQAGINILGANIVTDNVDMKMRSQGFVPSVGVGLNIKLGGDKKGRFHD